ncbi:Protein of unknown function DUF1800 [Burkholderiaceae bacterium]
MATASASLAACGGGADLNAPPGPGPNTGNPIGITEAGASRFLGQAAWGGNPTEIDRVIGSGQEAWLDQQMAMPIEQTFVQWLVNRGYGIQPIKKPDGTLTNANAGDAGMMPGLWRRLMSNPDLVRQRVALALSEFFVCSADKLITGMGYKQFAVGYYWDILEEHAFGNFRDLLEAVTLSPMMGIYLNTKGNTKATPGRVPDQNYAREVMQLFTIGLHELNPDGTEKKDAHGNPTETYTNEHIEGLSKVFTGWNFDMREKTSKDADFWQNCRWLSRPMILNDDLHSPEEKTFLGITIPPKTKGDASLNIALEKLFNHANTGPFFAKQMIQRLVTSNPSPAYVARVATKFANNGRGVRGDLKAVFKAILLDPEARQLDAGGTHSSFGKLREPMVRFIQWARTFSAVSVKDQTIAPPNEDVYNKEWVISSKIIHTESELGQAPMYAPSVFNFFRPGYTPPNSDIANQSMLAPEFQILTEPAIVGYVNFMHKTVNNGESWGAKPAGYLKADYSRYQAMAINPTELLNTLTLYLAPHAFSAAQINTMAQMLASIPNDEVGLKKRVYTAVLLIMCIPDYLIQR